MKRRVAITGMGTICGLGHNLNDTWNGLVEGKSGVSTVDSYDIEKLPIDNDIAEHIIYLARGLDVRHVDIEDLIAQVDEVKR